MHYDFEIADGIQVVQRADRLDLHNDYRFTGHEYSVEHRMLVLHWQREEAPVGTTSPLTVRIEFRNVTEFRFLPRDADKPFTEDDCLQTFGYWTDQEWAKGVITAGSDQADPNWLTALEFMSGAVILVQAASAHARIDGAPEA